MGIQGLQSFIERNCPRAFVNVDINSLALNYREATGREPVLVVDLASCIGHVYRKTNTNYLCGGQLLEFTAVFGKMLKRFRDLGIQCVLFSDGTPPLDRKTIWMARREEEYKKVTDIMMELSKGNVNEAERLSSNMRPYCSWKHLLSYLRAEKYPLIQTVREADDEIMEYIATNGCFGVLAQDSDFAIAEGVENYFSIEHLDLGSMTTRVYRRNELAAELYLDPTQLPLFATLSGNDIVRPEMLRDFHLYLLQDMHNIRQLETRPYLPKVHLFPRIARWISRKMRRGLEPEQLAREAALQAGYPHLVQLFANSITSYLLPPPQLPGKGTRVSRDGENDWERILKAADVMLREQYLYSEIHSIVTRAVKFGGVPIQFYNNNTYPSAGIVVRMLRRRLYGILLKDRPKGEEPVLVEEFIYHGPHIKWPESIAPIYPDEHPGLLNLWEDASCPVESKWRLLCWAVSGSVSVEAVRALPGPLQVPTLALYYLIHEVQQLMKRWEAAALVAQAVRLMSATAAEVRAIVCQAQDAGAVHLSTVYQSACQLVYVVAEACGSPTALHHFPNYVFFDGKLFHSIYMAMKNGSAGSELCGSRPQDLAAYQSVIRFIFPPKDK